MKCSFHHHPPWLLWKRNRWKQYVTSINRAIHLISISIYTRNGVFNEAIFQTGTPLISSPRRKKPKCNRNPIRFCNVHVHVRMLVRAFVIVIIRIENTKHTHTHTLTHRYNPCVFRCEYEDLQLHSPFPSANIFHMTLSFITLTEIYFYSSCVRPCKYLEI